jgi:hypothetical protein
MSASGWLRCGLASFVALLALGCGKTGAGDAPRSVGEGGGSTGIGGAPVVNEPDPCSASQPGPSPLLRRDGAQLASSLRDLLHDAPAALARLEPMLASLPAGDTDDVTRPPEQETVDTYHRLAHEAALAVSSDEVTRAAFVGCEPQSASCSEEFARRLLTRTSRRSPTTDEVAEALVVFEQGRALGGGSFASGVRALVEVVLQGPDFLYLLERDPDGCAP